MYLATIHKTFNCTNNKLKNKGKHYFGVPMLNNIEGRNTGQQWLHNFGTG